MELKIINEQGQSASTLAASDDVFGREFNQSLVHQIVTAYQANARQGTRAQKGRSDVARSGKKPWRQKGTGRARAGETRSPLWKKGGTVHGPVPHKYDKKVTVQEKKNALKAALSRKLRDEQIVVVDSLRFDTPKTKAFAERLEKLGVAGKTLVVDDRDNEQLVLAARNNPRVKTVDALGVNVYDVVDRNYLVLSEGALGRLVEVLIR